MNIFFLKILLPFSSHFDLAQHPHGIDTDDVFGKRNWGLAPISPIPFGTAVSTTERPTKEDDNGTHFAFAWDYDCINRIYIYIPSRACSMSWTDQVEIMRCDDDYWNRSFFLSQSVNKNFARIGRFSIPLKKICGSTMYSSSRVNKIIVSANCVCAYMFGFGSLVAESKPFLTQLSKTFMIRNSWQMCFEYFVWKQIWTLPILF